MRTIDEKEFLRLKNEVALAQKEAERARGAVDTLMNQLKTQFGFSSLADAKKGLAELEAKCEEAQAEFQRALKSYQEKWDDRH